jgi:transposase
MRPSRSPRERGLTASDRKRLRRIMEHATQARVFQRAQAVLLVAKGWSVGDVASITMQTRQAIYRWIARYLTDRSNCSFEDASRRGRPRVADELDRQLIDELLQHSPIDYGYMSTGWTVALLHQHLVASHQIELTARTLRRRLRELDYRWKRPRYVFTEADAHQAQKKGGSSAV